MDRRSWLWRRKSLEKTGETESSGSVSSHSERFSDEQVYPTLATQSPEVTSKAILNDEVADNVKTLTEKLSAALSNLRTKEELVEQHAKVAEEAVSGWEKAENDVLSLKQQLEAANRNNSMLEEQISHLDAALKECVRELRRAREEKEQKIHEIIANKTSKWESEKSELENKILDFEVQFQSAKADALTSISSDHSQRLEEVEKENRSIKHELLSLYEELEFRIIERDLSTQAAETASKQHLESLKKVTKLETECRRLKAIASKASPANDHKSFTTSSVCAESFTDSQSDCGERLLVVGTDMLKCGRLELNKTEPSQSYALITELDQFKREKSHGKGILASSVEIKLMDDFLEMERLSTLPSAESGSFYIDVTPVTDQPNQGESPSKDELEAMNHRTAELEEKIRKMEAERVEMEMTLCEFQKQLEASQGRLEEAELQLNELQTQLALTNKSRQDTHEELRATRAKNRAAESELRVLQEEMGKLMLKIGSLEEDIEKERSLSSKNEAKCRKLEYELSKIRHEAQLDEILHREGIYGKLKSKQDKGLGVAASRYSECQKTIASLGQQLKSLAALDSFLLESENH